MSQSDYIKFKKTGVILRNTDPSMNSYASYSKYDAFTDYTISTTVKNSSINYGKQTIPANVTQIFDMKLSTGSGCPTFVCVGRNTIPSI